MHPRINTNFEAVAAACKVANVSRKLAIFGGGDICMLVYRARRTPSAWRAPCPIERRWSAHVAPPRLRSPAREWTTRNELTVMDAELHTLLTELGKRSAGGAARSCHYLRPGPARQRYILACARAHAWAAPSHRTLVHSARAAPTLVAARPRASLTTHIHIATVLQYVLQYRYCRFGL